MAQHLAVKCTYNDGGEGIYVGFNGTCSENIIKQNIEQGRIWCSHNDCKCKQYYDGGFKGKRPEYSNCMESVLFRDWEYGAGIYHTGEKAGKLIHLSNVDKGKIAILTTRFPDDKEIDRKIIGFFKIAKVTNEPENPTYFKADEKFRARLLKEDAEELYFWNYYSTAGGAKWRTGLIRYINDDHVFCILKDIKEITRDEKTKLIINELLNQDFPNFIPKEVIGSRMHIKKIESAVKEIFLKRKYGYGGEGEEHKKLKEWVANNPEEIGLKNVRKVNIEYRFKSDDIVDVLFEMKGNKFAVVEIETVEPLPGCYQALKYKVLKCAEIHKDIKSSDVEAILVSYSIPKEAKNFCKKYGVRYVEKKL